jgi:hypothetical protein
MTVNAALVVEQSVDARRETGRSIRSSVPRSAHGEWAPSPDRADPLEVLETQAVSRLSVLDHNEADHRTLVDGIAGRGRHPAVRLGPPPATD